MQKKVIFASIILLTFACRAFAGSQSLDEKYAHCSAVHLEMYRYSPERAFEAATVLFLRLANGQREKPFTVDDVAKKAVDIRVELELMKTGEERIEYLDNARKNCLQLMADNSPKKSPN